MKCNLKVIRYIFNTKGDRNIIGDLFINDEMFCHTLEDELRPDGVKVYGKTAIPAGTYKVLITYSPKFKKKLPILCNVPNFKYIRIHNGVHSGHSEGCILVGHETDNNKIWGKCDQKLTSIIEKYDECEITIENRPLTYKQ
jgi:hypothetical protein